MLARKVKEVLSEFQNQGLLEHIVLIGSWCGVFYIEYFGEKNFSPSIQTLDVDFLIPRLGPKTADPQKIPALAINAMPLRHTTMLTEHLITLCLDGLRMSLPHPGAFALHKLFISERRQEEGKRSRDMEMAIRILEAIQLTGKEAELDSIWKSFTKKERAGILKVVKSAKREDLASLLSNIF